MDATEAAEALAQRLSNDVYAVAVRHYEQAEHAGMIAGNGHHLAQRLAETAKALFLERYAQKQRRTDESQGD